MELIKVSDLFEIKSGVTLFENRNGISSEKFTIYPKRVDGAIPFLRPAKSQQRTIAGWVKKDELHPEDVYPPSTIFVSTNGEGSHTYSYVTSFEFACNSDVSILIPKISLSLEEKIFYAKAISVNRYKFSYGRKPKGDKLASLKIPLFDKAMMPTLSIKDVNNELISKRIKQLASPIKLTIENWEYFCIKDLFDMEPTKGTTTDALISGDEIPYIAAKKEDNGLSKMCSRHGNEFFISKGNCIVFINLGQGSAGYSLYQNKDFIGMSGKISIGRNKNINKYNALFIVTILDLERPKFSFGRSWTGKRLLETKIKLPAIKTTNEEGKQIIEPDWIFMEDYIKSLELSEMIL